MKNSDEIVERVLTGLREAEAPDGMERRILDAVRDAQHVERAPRRKTAPWRFAETTSWATAAAGVTIVAGMLCWTSLRDPRAGDRTGNAIQGQSSISKQQKPIANSKAADIQTAVVEPVHPPQRLTAQAGNETHIWRSADVRERKSAGLRKVPAESFPAPPMPLTEQEKLLLRLAHSGDPQLLAVLNPVLRAMRDAEEKAEVESFFEPAAKEGNHE